MKMKFWTDDYECWAAETLDDLKRGKIEQKFIDESEWDPDDWEECCPNTMMWDCPLEDLDFNEMKCNPAYKTEMGKKYKITLQQAYDALSDKEKEDCAVPLASTEY